MKLIIALIAGFLSLDFLTCLKNTSVSDSDLSTTRSLQLSATSEHQQDYTTTGNLEPSTQSKDKFNSTTFKLASINNDIDRNETTQTLAETSQVGLSGQTTAYMTHQQDSARRTGRPATGDADISSRITSMDTTANQFTIYTTDQFILTKPNSDATTIKLISDTVTQPPLTSPNIISTGKFSLQQPSTSRLIGTGELRSKSPDQSLEEGVTSILDRSVHIQSRTSAHQPPAKQPSRIFSLMMSATISHTKKPPPNTATPHSTATGRKRTISIEVTSISDGAEYNKLIQADQPIVDVKTIDHHQQYTISNSRQPRHFPPFSLFPLSQNVTNTETPATRTTATTTKPLSTPLSQIVTIIVTSLKTTARSPTTGPMTTTPTTTTLTTTTPTTTTSPTTRPTTTTTSTTTKPATKRPATARPVTTRPTTTKSPTTRLTTTRPTTTKPTTAKPITTRPTTTKLTTTRPTTRKSATAKLTTTRPTTTKLTSTRPTTTNPTTTRPTTTKLTSTRPTTTNLTTTRPTTTKPTTTRPTTRKSATAKPTTTTPTSTTPTSTRPTSTTLTTTRPTTTRPTKKTPATTKLSIRNPTTTRPLHTPHSQNVTNTVAPTATMTTTKPLSAPLSQIVAFTKSTAPTSTTAKIKSKPLRTPFSQNTTARVTPTKITATHGSYSINTVIAATNTTSQNNSNVSNNRQTGNMREKGRSPENDRVRVLETNTSDTTLVTAHDLDKNTNQTIKPTIITTTGMMNKKRTKDMGVMPPYTNDINMKDGDILTITYNFFRKASKILSYSFYKTDYYNSASVPLITLWMIILAASMAILL